MYINTLGLVLVISISSSTALSPTLLLSPLIANNKIQDARKLSSVDPKLFLNVTSYTGFFTVEEKYDTNTFFWYFPVVGKPVNETPLIVWLQGGPGGSSLVGLFDEIGPFQYVNKDLKLREWSWAKEYSVLFIDNPPGAGFSSTNDSKGYVINMEMCANLLYNALTQFYQLFPELTKASLYIAGESSAGRFIPVFGMKIFEQNKVMGSKRINLQGIIMGNPLTSSEKNIDFSSLFYQWGLIDPQGKLAVKQMQDEFRQAMLRNDPTKTVTLRSVLLDRLRSIAMIPLNIQYNIFKDDPHLEEFEEFLQREIIKEAIHVGDIQFKFFNSMTYGNLINDFLGDSTPQVTALLDHYRLLIYCGQFDITGACVPNAEVRRDKWFWSHRKDFMKAPRTPWWYNESVAGYVKQGGGFTEVLVKQAGHMVPMDKPAATLQMITHFINGISFSMPPNYEPSPDDTPAYIINEKYTSIQPQYNTQLENNGHGAMIASVLINVLLVLVIVAGAVYVVKWKRRTVAVYNTVVDDISVNDGVLSMT